jgi:hypothetical protein
MTYGTNGDPPPLPPYEPRSFEQCETRKPRPAKAINSPAKSEAHKPRLKIEHTSPDRTVAELRRILANSGKIYDRGGPAVLAYDHAQGGHVASLLTPDALVMITHENSRPFSVKAKEDGTFAEADARFPRALATMYLDGRGRWGLLPLNGVTTSPLLREDGDIVSVPGYDAATGMWLDNPPDLAEGIPDRPSRGEAERALLVIREQFKTFCFADAETVVGPGKINLVDVARPPGRDESAFLAALMGAVCRASLDFTPGVTMRAAPMSGAGAGKGLLARLICLIAFGSEPCAITAGKDAEELEKRIGAHLMQGAPALFLDNLNNIALKSDLLASAITDRPATVRVLGSSKMVSLNALAFVIITGNGLSVSEDLARRFICVEFDAKTEDPESREFKVNIRSEVKAKRIELLAAILTIWRWGRLESGIKRGKATGSFEQWALWVRDPLLALGCKDPIERQAETKECDARRQDIAELFETWWSCHAAKPVKATALHADVTAIIDPQGRGRQFIASKLGKLDGTRMAGFVLTRQKTDAKWSKASYALKRTDRAPAPTKDAPSDDGSIADFEL